MLAVLSDLIQDPYPLGQSMSQTREQPAQQAHHAKGPWMVTAGGLDDGRSECVPISLDLGVSESRAEHRKSAPNETE